MPKTASLQTSFIAGELAPELSMRQDIDQYQSGAKSLRNYRCLLGGGIKRRPGTRRLANLGGQVRLESWIVNADTRYVVAFSEGAMRAYLPDGTAAGSVVGPWNASNYRAMQFSQSGNTMFVVHRDFYPQVISRTGPASWTCGPLQFSHGVSDRIEQPYLKMVDPAITIQPTALTGGTTITASSPIFNAAHVGHVIRYLGRQAMITAVLSPIVVVANIIEEFPNTQQLTVSSSAQFAIGEVIQGGTSNAKAQVTAIPNSTHINAIIIQRLQGFQSGETLIGPNTATTISLVVNTTPAAIDDWDEQVMHVVYGFPSAVELHRNRLLFAAHHTVPNYLIASTLGDLFNFNVGSGADADGFIESVGDAGAARITQLHSAEQLIVCTDHGPYYVPEGPSSPFRPSGIAFFPFGSPWPITSLVRAEKFDNGVVLLSGSLVIKAKPTGNTNNLWEADEISGLSPHLIRSPTDMAVVSNFAGGPERYGVLVNGDGTLCVMQLIETQRVRNFTSWDCNGAFISVAALDDTLYAAVATPVGTLLVVFDDNQTMDVVSVYSNLADATPLYGSGFHIIANGVYLGAYPLTTLDSIPAGPYTVGLSYETQLESLPPVIQGPGGSVAGDMMRILEADIFVQNSAVFSVQGTQLTAYQTQDNVTVAPPRRNGAQRVQFFGWKRDPTITVTQAEPLPLTILAMKMKVAYG